MKNKLLIFALLCLACLLPGCATSDAARVQQAADTLTIANTAFLELYERDQVNDQTVLAYDEAKDELELLLAQAWADIEPDGKLDDPTALVNIQRVLERVERLSQR